MICKVRGMPSEWDQLPLSARRLPGIVAFLVVLASFFISLHNLDHASVKPLDEVFHAIVARNLMRHPFTPTLDDPPYIDVDSRNWQDNGVWLHKPPMAMWQIAVSYAALGVNPLALRLPSAILAAAAAWLTFLIGRELLDPLAGAVAAVLQAFNPVIMMAVQGYVFSDHVDVALLFWVEVSILFLGRTMRTGRRRDAALCGVAQGLAFLSKTFPALIVTSVAVVMWLISWYVARRAMTPSTGTPGEGRGEGDFEAAKDADSPNQNHPHPNPPPEYQGRGKGSLPCASLALVVASALATIAPWLISIAIRFPSEFRHEMLGIVGHLSQDVEGWAAPWDRLVFDYSIGIYHVYYVPVLAAAIVLAVRAWQERSVAIALLLAWALGVLIPNTLAVSKTMTATMIGWPAFWLLLGGLASRAVYRGDRWAAATWTVSTVLAAALLTRTSIPREGWGYPSTPGFGVIMREHAWVIWHLAAALAGGAVVAWIIKRWTGATRIICSTAAAAMVFTGVRWWHGDHPRGYACVAWDVTQINRQTPQFPALARFARNLPPNAVFLVDENDKLENKLIQFATDRTCHPLANRPWEDLAAQVVKHGGLPFLVTSQSIPLPTAMVDRQNKQAVYACTGAARDAAARAAMDSSGRGDD
jgi:hypothetical protein